MTSFTGFLTGFWNHAQTMYRAYVTSGLRPPQLTESDLVNVYFFTQLLNDEAPPGDPRKGEAFVVRNRCVHCHSIGQYHAIVGPNLNGYNNAIHPLVITTAVWKHRQRMLKLLHSKGLPSPKIMPGDLAGLLAFFRANGRYTLMIPRMLSFTDLTFSKDVLKKSRCLSCHQLKDFYDVPLLSLYRINEILIQHAFMPQLIRSPYAEISLTIKDSLSIVMMIYYFNHMGVSGNPANGRRLFFAHGCIQCHADPESSNPPLDKYTIAPVQSLADFGTRIANKLPTMSLKSRIEAKAFPRLTEGELTDIFLYLCRLNPSCLQSSYIVPPLEK